MKAPALKGEARWAVRKEMRTAYEDGLTVAQVAARFGRSYGNTHQLLMEAGTAMRAQGGPRR